LKTGTRGYDRGGIDARDFRPQTGDQDVAEDRFAGGDEDCGSEELEDCAVLVRDLDWKYAVIGWKSYSKGQRSW
jgi:hypothetical protein